MPNPFAGLLPGTSLNGATITRQQSLLPVGAHAVERRLTAFLAAADHSRHLVETIELPDDHALAVERGADLARSMHDRLP